MLIIKEVIKEKGFTVTSLAEKLGMAQVSLSRIINGNPTVDTLEKIADSLEVEVIDLFSPKLNGETLNGFIEYDGEVLRIKSKTDLEKLLIRLN